MNLDEFGSFFRHYLHRLFVRNSWVLQLRVPHDDRNRIPTQIMKNKVALIAIFQTSFMVIVLPNGLAASTSLYSDMFCVPNSPGFHVFVEP